MIFSEKSRGDRMRKGFKYYKRVCKRCGRIYITTGKRSRICDDCNLLLKRRRGDKNKGSA